MKPISPDMTLGELALELKLIGSPILSVRYTDDNQLMVELEDRSAPIRACACEAGDLGTVLNSAFRAYRRELSVYLAKLDNKRSKVRA